MKKKRKKLWKKLASRIHLWLGMISGLIVFVIAVTGCIYVFQDEIKDAVFSWRFIQNEDRDFVAPSILFQNVREAIPESNPNMVVYHDKTRPAAISINVDDIPYEVYLNPFSAEIIHVQNLDTDFFMIVEHLHRFLLLPEEIGKQVTGVSTIIFLIMLVSGLILWWPKKWKNSAQNFKIKWKARWRRKNYDWHRATGFYLIVPAIIVAITGLSFSYEWVHEGLFEVGNAVSNERNSEAIPIFPKTDKITTNSALDISFEKTFSLMPDKGMYFVWDQGEGLPIVTGVYPKSLAFDHQSNFYFESETGDLLFSQFYREKNTGIKLQEMNFGLHTGQYFGIFGKIMAFITSLFVATLPVSGFLIWFGRRKK
ncbi:MAG: PepSY-associated TM helix domain-containing protein [Mesonia sp.]|uniref:PepSY-associated TM helix domain-containing protein n=1 Tax=Mesonia sp. TaxID=1960830 RepID=UPI003F9A8F25